MKTAIIIAAIAFVCYAIIAVIERIISKEEQGVAGNNKKTIGGKMATKEELVKI